MKHLLSRKFVLISILTAMLTFAVFGITRAGAANYYWHVKRVILIANDHTVPASAGDNISWSICNSTAGYYTHGVFTPSGGIVEFNLNNRGCIGGSFVATESGDYTFRTRSLGLDQWHTVDVTVSWNDPTRPSTSPVVERPPDHRTNWRMGDLEAVIYPEQGADGEPALHIYLVNAESRGELLTTFSSAQVANYIDNPPAVNTLVASAGIVRIYVLTSGELQVNIGTDAEGKYYVTIYDLETFGYKDRYMIDPA